LRSNDDVYFYSQTLPPPTASFANNPSFVYLFPIRTPLDRINKLMEPPPLGTTGSPLPSARSRRACGLFDCRTCVCVAHDVHVLGRPMPRHAKIAAIQGLWSPSSHRGCSAPWRTLSLTRSSTMESGSSIPTTPTSSTRGSTPTVPPQGI
jgi:hypothetical protein